MSTKKTKLSIQAPKVSAQTKSGAPKYQKQILTAHGQITAHQILHRSNKWCLGTGPKVTTAACFALASILATHNQAALDPTGTKRQEETVDLQDFYSFFAQEWLQTRQFD